MQEQTFSDAENRMLQTKPDFSWERLFSGKLTEAYESYLSDQFPLRETWIAIKSASELILQKKDDNGVFLGKDGYLLQKPEKLDRALLERNMEALNCFCERIHPVPVYFLLAPNAVHILVDRLPPFAAAATDTADIRPLVAGRFSTTRITLIDVYQTLTAHKEEYIYYRTDHHWTTKGAYYAYQKAAAQMGCEPLDLNDLK